MSYLLKIEYEIVPLHAYKIIRNCAGCKSKSKYVNTGNFRVNANGSKIDVWLIYQCEKCKHTYNLTVLERVNPADIPEEDYKKFLANDKGAALCYGMDKAVLTRNKAVIDSEDMSYSLSLLSVEKDGERIEGLPRNLIQIVEENEGKVSLNIRNPYGLKVRNDKLVCEIFQISRSKAKKLMEDVEKVCYNRKGKNE